MGQEVLRNHGVDLSKIGDNFQKTLAAHRSHAYEELMYSPFIPTTSEYEVARDFAYIYGKVVNA